MELLELLKCPQYWPHLMLERMWSNRTAPSSLVEIQNGGPALEDSLIAPNRFKHTLSYRTQKSCFLLFNQYNWKLIFIKLCCFIYNCPELEATKTPFSEWMDKYARVHSDIEILFSVRNKWAVNLWKDIENNECIRSQEHGCSLCYSFNLTFWKLQTCVCRVKWISSCWCVCVWGGWMAEHRYFRSVAIHPWMLHRKINVNAY